MARIRGVLKRDEPLSRHTVWGIGGVAEHFFEPADVDDLATFLSELPDDEPLFWLGLGSNVLVRDGGIEGTVIRVGPGLDVVRRVGERAVYGGAGSPCPKVARFSVRAGLGGCEFFAGIPGTVGGALAMNAGAYGGETWNIVEWVDTIGRKGDRHRRRPGEYRIGYRSVEGREAEWFVGARLGLAADTAGTSGALLRQLLRQRSEAQPTGARSCGSVFRNPPGDYAARLIEATGLKGAREGAAVVSEKHANFILNTGGATAADVERLMDRIVERVLEASGVRLEREVRIVGRPRPGEARRA